MTQLFNQFSCSRDSRAELSYPKTRIISITSLKTLSCWLPWQSPVSGGGRTAPAPGRGCKCRPGTAGPCLHHSHRAIPVRWHRYSDQTGIVLAKSRYHQSRFNVVKEFFNFKVGHLHVVQAGGLSARLLSGFMIGSFGSFSPLRIWGRRGRRGSGRGSPRRKPGRSPCRAPATPRS